MEGQTAADALLKKAEDNEQRTEAHAYIGIKAVIAKRRDLAIEHLRWVADNGAKSYIEYRMAETELKWLGATQLPER